MKKYVIKSDYNRVLLTEVLPYELPVIISNEGYYQQISDYHQTSHSNIISLIFNKLFFNFDTSVVPFEFEIIKSDTATRSLSLFHPSTQNEIVNLYQNYSSLIINNCKKSPHSLRAPTGFASTYYIKNAGEKKSIEKRAPETMENSLYSQYASSFFTYSKFSYMSSFYDSKMYMNLEAKYKFMRRLDISNCFGNIYTHSLSWALKPKKPVKEVISDGLPKGGIDSVFDKIMQKSNLNETNGILVGSEVSRVFAELILQEVDQLTSKDIQGSHFKYSKDIEFYRYMDDYFIFYNDEGAANLTELNLSRRLREFKLSLNESKKEDFTKPFITPKTRAEIEIKDFIQKQLSELFEICSVEGNLKWVGGKEIYKNFLKRLRVLIISTHVSYQDASKISLKEIQSFIFNKIHEELDINSVLKGRFASFLKFLIEISFYLYSNDKRYATSYSLVLTIYKICSFVNALDEGFDEEFEITDFISKHIVRNISYESMQSHCLETCNFILLLSETSTAFDIAPQELNKIIKDEGLNYFTVISLLYLFGKKTRYSTFKVTLCKKVVNYLLGKSEYNSRPRAYKSKYLESELVHLFCDFVSCPYIDVEFKQKAIKEFLEPVIDKKLNDCELEEIITNFNKGHWFVNWNEISFNTYLQKKRLNSTY